jgi:hypothetical protein
LALLLRGYEPPVVLRSFVSSVPLEDYGYWVKLPEGLS